MLNHFTQLSSTLVPKGAVGNGLLELPSLIPSELHPCVLGQSTTGISEGFQDNTLGHGRDTIAFLGQLIFWVTCLLHRGNYPIYLEVPWLEL